MEQEIDQIVEYYYTEIKRHQRGENCCYVKGHDKKLKNNIEIDIPNINTIDGMKVNRVFLRFVCHYRVWLEITSDSIRTGYEKDNEDVVCFFEDEACKVLYSEELVTFTAKSYTKSILKKYLRMAIDTLPKLTFDRYKGSFTKNAQDIKFSEAWCSIMDNFVEDNKGISCKHEECCVCRENTLTTTHCCGNHLCYSCWDKIKEREDDEKGNFAILPCPMCRHDLRWNDTINGWSFETTY